MLWLSLSRGRLGSIIGPTPGVCVNNTESKSAAELSTHTPAEDLLAAHRKSSVSSPFPLGLRARQRKWREESDGR